MHTVRFSRSGDECNTVEAEDGETILSVADRNGIDTQRACNGGHCGACRMRIKEGIQNILNKHTQKPFKSERVKTCVAEIHGDIEVEPQAPRPKPTIEATLPSSEQ